MGSKLDQDPSDKWTNRLSHENNISLAEVII